MFSPHIESILIEVPLLEGDLEINRCNDQPMEVLDREQTVIMARDDDVHLDLTEIAEFYLIEVV